MAVADGVRSRADATASQYGGRAHHDGMALLGTEELDTVWLCVPPYAHGPLESAALDRRLPFFVEKPLGVTLGDAIEINNRATDTGVLTAASSSTTTASPSDVHRSRGCRAGWRRRGTDVG